MMRGLVKPDFILTMAGESRSKKIILTDEARVLKRLRIANDLSLQQVAMRVSKSHSTIAHLENGRMGVPRGKTFEAILEVYGVSLRTFQNYVGSYKGKRTTRDEILELLDRLNPEKHEIIYSFQFLLLLSQCGNYKTQA